MSTASGQIVLVEVGEEAGFASTASRGSAAVRADGLVVKPCWPGPRKIKES